MHIHAMLTSLLQIKGLSNHWVLVLTAVGIWEAIWKGFALYRAGRAGQKGWFIAMFILNTAGILEILYYFVFAKRRRR